MTSPATAARSRSGRGNAHRLDGHAVRRDGRGKRSIAPPLRPDGTATADPPSWQPGPHAPAEKDASAGRSSRPRGDPTSAWFCHGTAVGNAAQGPSPYSSGLSLRNGRRGRARDHGIGPFRPAEVGPSTARLSAPAIEPVSPDSAPFEGQGMSGSGRPEVAAGRQYLHRQHSPLTSRRRRPPGRRKRPV